MSRYHEQTYVGRHTRPGPVKSRSRIFKRFLLILLTVLICAYPFVEPLMLETEVISLVCEDLPDDIGQLRIVYLSDIHAGPFFSQHRVDSLVSRVNSLYADIVLLGGDYATDSTSAIAFFQNLPTFNARYGVYAVMGNHDRVEPETNLTLLIAAMKSAGVTPLVNEVAPLRIGQNTIYLAGIDEYQNGHPDIPGVAAKTRRDDFVIYLTHNPNAMTESLICTDMNGNGQWFDLVLMGHTHGGQIALLGQILDFTHTDSRYTQGWQQINRAHILVSRGVGTSILPMRLFCRPQIHQITLTSD